MSDSPVPYKALLDLFIALSDGSISDEDFVRLDAVLGEDARARAFYLEFMRTSAMLEQRAQTQADAQFESDGDDALALLGLESLDLASGASADDLPDVMSEVIDQALALRRQHEVEEEANRQLAAQQGVSAQDGRYRLGATGPAPAQRRGLLIPLPLVVGGVVAALLFIVVYLFTPTAPEATDSGTAAQNPRSGSGSTVRERFGEWVTPAPPVAGVVSAHAALWGNAESDGQPTHRPGADGRMTPGRYALASGAVELRLDGGAVLLVEGPAQFELLENDAGRLIAGQLSIDTASAADGFRLETPTADLRALGRGGRFGIAVASDGQTSAHVYAGRMDMTNLAPTGRATTLQLTANRGAVVARADAAPRLAPVAAERFALEMAALRAKPVVTGDADYFNHLPASVVMNRGPQSPRAWVALESTGRPLMRGTAWAQSYPSDPSVLIDPEGRVVDSYLVVFDPADETPGRFHTVEFTLTFPNEVMTIITQNQDLAQSHGWYGTEATRYEELGQGVDGLDPGVADGDAAIEPADSVSLSDDGRTLRVSIRVAPAGADVFRVLVVRPARTGQAPPLPGRTQALFFRGTADAVSPKSFTPHRHF